VLEDLAVGVDYLEQCVYVNALRPREYYRFDITLGIDQVPKKLVHAVPLVD